jgi:hypothetical protein
MAVTAAMTASLPTLTQLTLTTHTAQPQALIDEDLAGACRVLATFISFTFIYLFYIYLHFVCSIF